MLSYPVIDRDRERLASDLGYVRQAEATSSVVRPQRRAHWFAWTAPTPRRASVGTRPLGVH